MAKIIDPEKIKTNKNWIAIIILLGIILGIFWQYLFSNPIPLIYPVSDLGTDLPREIWPLAEFIKTNIQATGELPLWRPYLLSGAPLIGHPVAPVFYIPNWLILILPIPLALNILAVTHFFWAGLGTFNLIRKHYGLNPAPALFGGVLFALAPKWIAHLSGGHWPMLVAIAWWPWAYYGFARYWHNHEKKWGVLLGLALAAQALNHGTYLSMSLIWLGVFTLLQLKKDKIKDWLKKSSALWGIAFLIMLGLSAVQLLPMLELIPYSNRAGLSLAESSFGSLPPAALIGLFFPSGFKFPEWFIYPGVGVLFFAALSWVYGWGKKEKTWGFGILIAILISLGSYTPLYKILYKIIPGFSLLRIPTRWWIFVLFGLVILASFGLQNFLEKNLKNSRRNILLFALLLIYIIALLFQSLPFNILISSIFVLIGILSLIIFKDRRARIAIVFLIVIFDIALVKNDLLRPLKPELIAQEQIIQELDQNPIIKGYRYFIPYGGIETSTVVASEIFSASGYDSFHLHHYAEYIKLATNCDFKGYLVGIPATRASVDAVTECPEYIPNNDLLAFLGIHTVILPENIETTSNELNNTLDGLNAFSIQNPLEELFIPKKIVFSPPEECFFNLQTIDPLTTSITNVELPFQYIQDSSNIEIIENTPNKLKVLINSQSSFLLVRPETWAPGWKVYIDDEQTELIKVNCAFQGVWVEEGNHMIHFQYQPDSYSLGRWISLSTLIALIIWSTIPVIKSSRGKNISKDQ